MVMFPGVDALEDPKYREAVWQVKSMRAAILKTEQLIRSIGVTSYDLEGFMKGAKMEMIDYFSNMIVCSFATQVAIFEAYEKQGLPCDYLMGISLGDIARNICAKIGSYEVGVTALLKFVHLVRSAEKLGVTYFMKLPEPYAQLKDALQFEAYAINISVKQNPRFFLLAGEPQNF
ncbi:MAG: hypothetical protein AAF570_13145, partial [Bacteroidota bacterium]